MSGTRTRVTGISTRVTLLTFLSVSAAVLVVALIAISGVYRLTLSEDLARAGSYRQLIIDDLNARLRIIDGVVTALESDVRSRSVAPSRPAIMRPLQEELQYVDSVVLVERSGRRTVVAGPARVVVPKRVLTAVRTSVPGRTSFVWVEPGGGSEGQLWAMHSAEAGGSDASVLVRVRIDFLIKAADDVARQRASVATVISDARGHTVRIATSIPMVDPAAVRYSNSAGSSGDASVISTQYGVMSGSWSTVGSTTGLDWRVAVMESEVGSLTRVRAALTPAGISMIAVLALAVLAALLYSRRLVTPLRVFERSARDVASGGYVRPLHVDRDDELGLLADAFNDMGVRLNSLQDMVQLLASAANLDDVLDELLNALGHILATGDAAVMLASADGSELSLARGRGLAVPGATLVVPLGTPSPLATAFREQRTESFTGDDAQGLRPVYDLFKADPARAGVAVPLVTAEEVIGVVVVIARSYRPFTAPQIETLRVFSANAAVAVRTSRLFAEERASRTEAEALRTVAELTSRASDLARALQRASDVAAELLGYRECGVIVEKRQQLGLGLPSDPEADRLLMSVWRLVLTAHPERQPSDSTPIVLDDEHDGPRLGTMLGSSWSDALFIPLMQGRSVRGALILHDRIDRSRLSERHLAVARSIGQQVSLAIRNAFLLQQARTRAANLETVFHISQAVSSELKTTVVLDRVLDVVQKILSADAVALMSYDSNRRLIETTMARGVTSRDLLYFSVAPGEDIPGRVFETHAPLVFGGMSHRPTPLAALAADQGFESLLAVPLLARGRAIGVLAVYAEAQDAFSGEDMELLLTFASQAAIAIDTAFLYGREHRLASVLQSSILPDVLPDVAGIETASFYLPSGAEAEIGGDYYDMFAVQDGRIMFAIGDVCGKGVVAATKTSMVKYALRGLLGAGVGPAEALAEVNRQVSFTGDPADIVTVWVGLLDVASGELTYADAGHPPALLCRGASQRVEQLSATGPLLGAVPDAQYTECLIRFDAGDGLLLYTDGVTEARHEGEFFGAERLRNLVTEHATARECIDALLSELVRFSAGPLRDDAAALAIRRLDS